MNAVRSMARAIAFTTAPNLSLKRSRLRFPPSGVSSYSYSIKLSFFTIFRLLHLVETRLVAPQGIAVRILEDFCFSEIQKLWNGGIVVGLDLAMPGQSADMAIRNQKMLRCPFRTEKLDYGRTAKRKRQAVGPIVVDHVPSSASCREGFVYAQ